MSVSRQRSKGKKVNRCIGWVSDKSNSHLLVCALSHFWTAKEILLANALLLCARRIKALWNLSMICLSTVH